MSLVPKYCDRDLAEAWSLQRKLKEVLHSAQPGQCGADSLQEIQELCDRALLAIPDEPFQEKLCEMERYAADFLAAGRGVRLDRDATPGAVFQRRLILTTLEAINDRLASLETLRRDVGLVPAAAPTLQKF